MVNKFTVSIKIKKKKIAIKINLLGLFSEDDATLEDDETLEGYKEEIEVILAMPPLEGDEEKFIGM